MNSSTSTASAPTMLVVISGSRWARVVSMESTRATLPLGTVLDRSSGSYKNIIVERVDSVETTLAHLLPEMTTNIVGALAGLVLLFI